VVRWQLERGVRLCERNNSADTKVSEAGREGGARDPRAENFPLQPVIRTTVRQIVPLHTRAGGCLKEAVTPWAAPSWSRLLAGPVDPWREEPTPEQVCWQGL